RISEEKDRRKREAATLENLPRAVEELHTALTGCIETYQQAFAPEAASLHLQGTKIRVIARHEVDGRWQQSAKVEVTLVPTLPGFQVDNGAGGEQQLIDVGL